MFGKYILENVRKYTLNMDGKVSIYLLLVWFSAHVNSGTFGKYKEIDIN